MEILKKHSRLVAVAAFSFFYLAFWYMASDIIDDDKEITEDTRTEEVEEIRDIYVSLVITGGGIQESFREHMLTNETIEDLLETVYESRQITFEQESYTYGTEIISINNVPANNNYKWKIYHDDKLVEDFTGYRLVDDGIYTIRLELVSQ